MTNDSRFRKEPTIEQCIDYAHKNIESEKLYLYYCKKYALPTTEAINGLKASVKSLSYWLAKAKDSEDA